MSDDRVAKPNSSPDEPKEGFNLALAYSLIAAAIIGAICIALFIVFPFYSHRH
jgi:hypothetical protein